jgi:hypothetical protein
VTRARTFIAAALIVVGLGAVVGWGGAAHGRARATVSVAPVPASGPLRTAVFDPFMFDSADRDVAFQRIHDAGATAALLNLSWEKVAPGGTVKPAGFDASDPAAAGYNWQEFDSEVRSAVAHGLEPIALVGSPPKWAADVGSFGTYLYEPSPTELHLFAIAAAKRYSGTFLDLPRVRYWALWNEPNLPFYLEPQTLNGSPFSPSWYRDMLNQFADGVHGVAPDNLVVAGNLAPFTSKTGTVDLFGLAPLVFMRSMLCLGKDLRPTCSNPAHFDIWAHHPYTSGGPNHQAFLPDDVSLGDLPLMRKTLVAGITAGHVVSSHDIQFWVTEFSWDSNPPDPGGLKPALGARWTAEALYRMWSAGVTMVTWFLVTDQPMNAYFAQSGLYLRGTPSPQADTPKSILRSFRFPFVAYQIGAPKAGSNRAAAYRNSGFRVLVWGRVPSGARDRALVEQLRGGIWRPVATLTTNTYGIFGRKLYVPSRGVLRARALGEGYLSHSFSLGRPKDHFVSPFGDGWTDGP